MIRQLTAEKSWFIEWTQQWSQFWEDCSWYDFDLVWIRFENDKLMGGLEATFIILGLGLRWRWNKVITPAMQECLDGVESIRNGTADLIPWEQMKKDIMGDVDANSDKAGI